MHCDRETGTRQTSPRAHSVSVMATKVQAAVLELQFGDAADHFIGNSSVCGCHKASKQRLPKSRRGTRSPPAIAFVQFDEVAGCLPGSRSRFEPYACDSARGASRHCRVAMLDSAVCRAQWARTPHLSQGFGSDGRDESGRFRILGYAWKIMPWNQPCESAQ